MTLFATLLLNNPVCLPAGALRTHIMDGSLPPTNSANALLRQTSILLVEQAIAYDFKNRDEIRGITKLSPVTVAKVISSFIDEGRVVVDARRGHRNNCPKLFYKMKDES